MQEEKSYSLPTMEISYNLDMPSPEAVRKFILQQSELKSEGSKGSLAEWSRALGKNHAYLYQFIHKKTPKKLDEDTRRKLADILGVPEEHLMVGKPRATEDSPDDDPRPESGILEIDVRAGMGGGGTAEGREVRHHGDYADPVKAEAWHFPARFMREEVRAPEARVIVIETQGDSMSPTILSGDRVIVDTGHLLPSPDGIYAVRDQYGFIVVKRLQVLRKGDKRVIRIISDNKAHDAEDVGEDEIEIVGRVLWSLKRL